MYRQPFEPAAKSLVQFVRKRDPRYKEHQVQQATLQDQLKEQSISTQATLKRRQVANRYVEQEWQRVDGVHEEAEWAIAEGENTEEWECVVCSKVFRSEAAWTSHERSKKHIKEVERLRYQMQKENAELGLDADEAGENVVFLSNDPTGADSKMGTTPPSTLGEPVDELGVVFNRRQKRKKDKTPQKVPHTEVDDPSTDDLEKKDVSRLPPAEISKRDKRRAREAKKAEQKESAQVSVHSHWRSVS